MNDEEIEYITDLLFNENWKEQKDLILFTKDLKTANRRLAEQVNQLQFNWNSLREFFEKGKKEPNYIKGDMFWNEFCEISLDKMNELEGVDDEQ